MGKVSVSFRTDQKKVKQLDSLAKRQHRARTQLIDEALENYLEVQKWQMEEIRTAIREADSISSKTSPLPRYIRCAVSLNAQNGWRIFQRWATLDGCLPHGN